jgi:hypothetical protein
MGRYYILRGDTVAEEPNFGNWAAWHAGSYEKVRCIARTGVKFGAVQTIFLGINMALADTEPPLLFETRVIGGWLNDQWEHYSTIDDAKAGHDAWVARIRALEKQNELPPPDCPVW